MEELPPPYIETATPLILLSGLGEDENTNQPGLGQESGARIVTESAECRTEQASQLLQQFVALDGTRYAAGSPGNNRYKIKCIGRHYTLPARKSAPLAKSPGADGTSASKSTELHSPLSPLSPGSPVFPDGLLPPAWFAKHQHQVPCLFLAFFTLDGGEDSSQDESLKNDINAARSALTRSGFKTRFAAILIGGTSILDALETEERLSSIRRATGLDAKGVYFMPPTSSQDDIATFAQSIMTAVQPSCVEYYRDLTKNSRRKKARGGPAPQLSSPSGGASQSTSTSGWNVRYDVKMGVFAEFRGEMDVAERHFSAAIEELFSSEGGVLETTANWSPRWNEARMLSDSIALRLIRCQLWTKQTSGAAQSWQNYKLRMQDLIDRRGKGSSSYGWSAWEARWASIMSQLIQLAEVPTLQKSLKGMDSSLDITARQVYAPPEKAIAPTDRIPPFNLLHHSGYWLRLFASGIRNRWTRALAIPEEDRVPPGRSPASKVANRFVTYDTYLVPEPHEEMPISGKGAFDHVAELGMVCIRAAEEFEARQQIRLSEQIRLDLAEDFIRIGRYSDALSILGTLWEESTWREDSWAVPFKRLLHSVAKCIDHDKSEQNATLVPVLTWELLAVGALDHSVNIADCLDEWESLQPISVLLEGKQRRCPVSISFAFKDLNAHVGELLSCQLVLSSIASETSRPLQISSLEFWLSETKKICIKHEASASKSAFTSLSRVELYENDKGDLEGAADLNLQPSKDRILSISMVLRSAQSLSLMGVSLHLESSKFTLVHKLAEESIKPCTRWHVEHDGEISTVLIPHMDTKSVEILPKPPKMQVLLPSLREQYFCDENVVISVLLINDESEAVEGTIVSSIVNEAGETIGTNWSTQIGDVRTISSLDPSAKCTADVLVRSPSDAATMTLSLVLRYNVLSDPNTPLEKTLTLELAFVHPFATNFTFLPRLHTDSWPSYFDKASKGTEEAADGVLQLWQCEAHIASLIEQALTIEKVELVVHEVQGDCHCSVSETASTKKSIFKPKDKIKPTFALTTRKFSLDDRRPSYLFLSLVVHWSHESGSGVAATAVDVPRLTIPTAEPRVLCVADESSSGTVTLSYHLENPSTHFLTFALSMEASEDFAFSGPKYRALSLAPLSRHHVEYHLVVHKDADTDADDADGFWITPHLSVVDSYYNKSLRVHPGGAGVKLNEEKKLAVWIGKPTQ